MPPDFNPQAASEQVTQRLDALQTSQDGMKQVLIQTVDIQTSMLETQHRMLATQHQAMAMQQQMLATQNQTLETQTRTLEYMKFTFAQQAKWNERQDQFNIIILEEIRELKGDVREIKKKVFGEIESRLMKARRLYERPAAQSQLAHLRAPAYP